MENHPLTIELATFEGHRLEWNAAHHGEYVVIQDDKVLGFFPDWAKAVTAAYRNLGAERNFLVKEVLAQDRVIFIGVTA